MISVCMATYNGAKYIRQQLDSILCQLGDGDEVVISDDGSTDTTVALISSYGDPRIRLFHHTPLDVTTTFPLDKPTRNFEHALRNARGEIIFLADQDDIWREDKVRQMKQALEHADLAVHDCVVVDSLLQPIADSYFEQRGVHQGVLRNFYKASYLGCCMAFKRSVLKTALPIPPTKVGHDLWLGIVADMKFRTTLVRQPLIYYRKHGESMTSSGRESPHTLWFKISYRATVLIEILRLWMGMQRKK